MFVSRKKYDELHAKYKEALTSRASQKCEYEKFIAALQSELRTTIVDYEVEQKKNALLTERLALADRIIKHYEAMREADSQKEVECAEFG